MAANTGDTIPQDFLDIDPSTAHWDMTPVAGPNTRFPDRELFCVPATETDDGKRLSDMTDAMMSEIPGWDDTVESLNLEDKRGYKFCMAFLMQDGNLGVPGGRYGSDTRTCAHIAILMALVFRYHQGEPFTYYSLSSDMGQVVNSGDGVTELLSESGYILVDYDIDVKELLGDATFYLIPNLKVTVEFYEGKPISVELPATVDMTVVETEPGLKGATVSNVTKPAKLETGLVVQVPPFISEGEKIRVNTAEGTYQERA